MTKLEHLYESVASPRVSPRAVGDAIRSVIAGSDATKVLASSMALFEAGGKHLLDEGTKSMVKSAVSRGAESALAIAAGPLLGPVTAMANKPMGLLASTGTTLRAVAPVAAKTAGKAVLKGAGRAAGMGLVLDGAVASVEALIAVRNGAMDRKGAMSYIAKEAATGAVATGAGVLVGASLVALTGGVAAPVVFAVAALGSLGTKRALRRLIREPREVVVRGVQPNIIVNQPAAS